MCSTFSLNKIFHCQIRFINIFCQHYVIILINIIGVWLKISKFLKKLTKNSLFPFAKLLPISGLLSKLVRPLFSPSSLLFNQSGQHKPLIFLFFGTTSRAGHIENRYRHTPRVPPLAIYILPIPRQSCRVPEKSLSSLSIAAQVKKQPKAKLVSEEGTKKRESACLKFSLRFLSTLHSMEYLIRTSGVSPAPLVDDAFSLLWFLHDFVQIKGMEIKRRSIR